MHQSKKVLPKLNAGDKNLPRISESAWKALQDANNPPFLFRYGGALARIAFEDGAAIIRVLNQHDMRYVLARVGWWYREYKGSIYDALPPLHVVHDMLVRPNSPLPILARIIEAPVFASCGGIHTRPGYDSSSRCFYTPAKGLLIPDIPPQPSQTDVARAYTLITTDLLGDFPFVGEAERAHAVALMLLPFARALIAGPTPLHLIEKPAPGTGAGLLVDMLMYPFLGRPVSVMAEGTDEAEWRKRLTAKLMSGGSIILIDNLRKQLDSGALSAALTGVTWEDRILGESKIAILPAHVVWIATGNNPVLSNEMARRTVRIRLDAGNERPWLRQNFRHSNLRGWAKQNRGELTWAALTLIQAWVMAGKPDGKIIMGSFDQWSKVIGGILQVAGIDGFLKNLDELYAQSDTEGQALNALVHEWYQRHKDKPVGVSELYDIVSPSILDNPIELDLGSGSFQSRRTKLGMILKQNRNRRFGDLIITEAGRLHGAQQWKLVKA